MFSEFFPEIVKGLLIEFDVVDHVVEVGVNDLDNLFDVMSSLTPILDLEL